MSRRTLLLLSGASALLALAAALSACGTPPADLDLRLRQTSAAGRFIVELQPPEQAPVVGRLHAWTVRLTTPDGRPVRQAAIAVDGGMPQHGHGLPTQPRVTQELAPGHYRIDGMKFSMRGWWDLRLEIDAAGVRDRAVFNLVLTDTGLKP